MSWGAQNNNDKKENRQFRTKFNRSRTLPFSGNLSSFAFWSGKKAQTAKNKRDPLLNFRVLSTPNDFGDDFGESRSTYQLVFGWFQIFPNNSRFSFFIFNLNKEQQPPLIEVQEKVDYANYLTNCVVAKGRLKKAILVDQRIFCSSSRLHSNILSCRAFIVLLVPRPKCPIGPHQETSSIVI